MHLNRSLVALCLLLPMSAQAAESCDFYAYANDPDPSGTNLRAGPGTDHEVLTVLPQSVGPDGFTPEFHVIGFEDGWFEIEDVWVGQYGDTPEEELFEGPGWISARLVAFDIEDQHLLAEPGQGVEAVADLSTEAWTSNGVFIEDVHACRGAFVDVTVSNHAGESARGWAGDICGNQATTCP